jgi:hypothetical protein
MRILAITLSLAASSWLTGRALSGDDKGTEVTLGDMKARTPASWKMTKMKTLRKYSFSVPHAPGDGEDADLAIFEFPMGGGKAADNIKRWKGQFQPPEGKTIDEATKVETIKIGKSEATYVDIHGTYKDPFMANAKPMPNYRRLGVILAIDGGSAYITFTGPAKTIEQNKRDFDNWLKAFK